MHSEQHTIPSKDFNSTLAEPPALANHNRHCERNLLAYTVKVPTGSRQKRPGKPGHLVLSRRDIASHDELVNSGSVGIHS
jgi:hypothetical protein